MKLLLITQKIDRNDSVLGFMHGWIAALAPRFSRIAVICLEEGNHALPANVAVYSLGKELGRSRYEYLYRFFLYLWRLRRDYDSVFVHMNPEYVVLAGLWWRATGKRVVLWYNHIHGGVFARVAGVLAHRICFVSPFSFFGSRKNATQMPAGIDTDLFTLDAIAPPRTVLSLGRISPVKNLEVLIDAARLLVDRGVWFQLSFYGNPTLTDRAYAECLRERARLLIDRGAVHFHPGVPHGATSALYHAAQIFVNCTNSGSMDKTTLEAMACGVVPLVSNRAYAAMLPPDIAARCMFREGDVAHCAAQFERLLALPDVATQQMRLAVRDVVLQEHSLRLLVERITQLYE